MSEVIYQITLRLDGNHSVSVSGDDPTSVNDGLAWAKGIALKLRAQAQPQTGDTTQATQTIHHDIRSLQQQTPMCAIHQQPMAWQKGSKGFFWSCHEKLTDGSWCPYRPTKEIISQLPG